jgi:hypothetical protein
MKRLVLSCAFETGLYNFAGHLWRYNRPLAVQLK